ncbi:MAG: cephalosporin hydroxylase family protein [Nitrosarchaeum sp.]
MVGKFSFKSRLNHRGKEISEKCPSLLPFLRFTKKVFFSKYQISWWGSRMNERHHINKFCKIYSEKREKDSRIWQKTTWLGTSALKLPTDLWIYQEILYDVKPDLIIETGTMYGGSALFLATICDVIKKGSIVSIDINRKDSFPVHERIKYITGSSTDEKTVDQVKNMIKPNDKVMVILDSDHTKNHVLDELKIYSRLVSKDNYLIVEDTAINGHPVEPNFGDGPMEAVKEFLKTHDEFEIDKDKEKFLLTWNPNGYLKKIKD